MPFYSFYRFFLRTLPIIFLMSLCEATATLPEPLPSGVFKVDGVEFGLIHFSPNWRSSTSQNRASPSDGFPKITSDSWQAASRLQLSGGQLEFVTELEQDKEGGLLFKGEVAGLDTVPTEEIALQVLIPIALVKNRSFELNGVRYSLPTDFEKQTLLHIGSGRERSLVNPTATGSLQIEGRFELLVQDHRQWNQEYFGFRIRFLPEKGQRSDSVSFELKLQSVSLE